MRHNVLSALYFVKGLALVFILIYRWSVQDAFHLLTGREVAKALRVSTRTLDRAIKIGEIGCVRMGANRGRILFRPCDVENYATRRFVPVDPAAI